MKFRNILLISLFMFIVSINCVYADTTTKVYYNSGSGYDYTGNTNFRIDKPYLVGTIKDAAFREYDDLSPFCAQEYDSGLDVVDGIYKCVRDYIHHKKAYGERLIVDLDDYYAGKSNVGYIYFYDASRVDVWGSNPGVCSESNFNDSACTPGYYSNGGYVNAGGIVNYPGMKLNYNEEITVDELNDYKDLHLISVDKIDYVNDVHTTLPWQDLKGESTQKFWDKWKVDDSKWEISGLNNNGNTFTVKVDIDSLSSQDGNVSSIDPNIKLGLFGDVKTENNNDSIYTYVPKADIVYHYWIPFVAKFEFTPEDVENKVCLYGGKDKSTGKYLTSQEYAYKYLNTCCLEYPETCCTSTEWIQKLMKDPNYNSNGGKYKNAKWDLTGLCCDDNEEIDYGFKSSLGNNLGKLRTWSYKDFINNNKELYKELYNKWCKSGSNSCKNANEFSPGNTCCNKYPNKYPNKCIIPTKHSDCNDYTYFNNNKDTCCANFDNDDFESHSSVCCDPSRKYTDEQKKNLNTKLATYCPNPTTGRNAYIDSCTNKNLDNKPDMSNTTDNITVKETLSFENNPDDFNRKANSGSGFSYNINLKDEINLSYTRKGIKEKYKNVWCDDLNNTYKETKNDLIRKLESIFKNTNSNNTNIILSLEKYDDDYNRNYDTSNIPQVLNYDEIQDKKDPSYVGVSCKYINSEGNVDTKNKNIRYAMLNYNLRYSLSLKDCYLKYGDTSRKCYYDKEGNIDFYNVGSKIYIPYNQNYDVLNYNISISNGGITNKVTSNSSNKYKCNVIATDCLGENMCKDPDPPTPPNPPTPPDTSVNKVIFRPISLTNPFPNNREPGMNWNGDSEILTTPGKTLSLSEKYITTPANTYKEPIYSVTLTSDVIQNIKGYNSTENACDGYLDWSTMETDGKTTQRISTFLTKLKSGKYGKANVTLPSKDKRKASTGELKGHDIISIEEVE